MEKENEINDLRRRIIDKLDEERQDKAEKEAEHQREADARREKNIATQKQLGEILLNLNKGDWLSISINTCKIILSTLLSASFSYFTSIST